MLQPLPIPRRHSYPGSATEKAIKEATKATIRCLPYDGQGPAIEPGRCIKTGAPSARRVLFAKNY